MEDPATRSDIIKAKNGKELKFSEDTTKLKSGVEIYTWRLEPQNVELRGIIFIAHGYGEHSGLYRKFDERLCSELDIVVVGHDRVGHGKSGGERAMIDTLDTFVEDVFAHLDEVKKVYPDIPVYLFGHSMGGTVAILAACSKPEYFKAVVLSAPAITADPDLQLGALKMCLAKMAYRFFPRMEIIPPLDPNHMSSDPNQVEAYRTDPLIWHGAGKLGFSFAFSDAMDEVKQLIPAIQWPFLVVHGEADKITPIGGSQLLAKDAKSQDKEIKIYKDLKHGLLLEVEEEAEKVTSDIVEWLRKRIES